MNMIKPIESHQLFYTPIWRFEYPNFKQDEEYLVRYFAQDNLYLAEREKNGLQITRANIHKDKNVNKLTNFFQSCAESVMQLMGYKKDCCITSMWATRQRANGFHHKHSHHNSFLGGSFHLFDMSGNASGTIFHNTDIEKYLIQPAHDTNKELILKSYEELKFKPGTLVMFPAWATHSTAPTQCDYRIIVALNVMPVGMTNQDHYDRYNYPNMDGVDLMEYQNE
ncbi:MAG: hypothetical protein EB127_31035 [Alphaproteobacteria bacterium]|nr:hypothetical protein [Alphaproteobacteria bacterium]